MRFIGVDSRVTRVIYGFPWQILIRNRVGRIIKRWGEVSMEWQFYALSGAETRLENGRESDWKWPGVI